MSRKFLYKKGLSTIVVTLILVALSMAAIALVWAFVSNFLKKQMSGGECFGNAEKVTLNGRYTCYEQISASNYKLRFSLSIGDVSVEKVIVSASYGGGNIKSYEITNTAKVIDGLRMYSGTNPSNIILPGKNSGLTYNATGFNSKIETVQIAPVIGGAQCEVSDSIPQIESCT